MIVTNDFVVINFPKTGSSFTRRVLKKIHGYNSVPWKFIRKLNLPFENSLIEYQFPIIDFVTDGTQTTRHGLYSQIPEQHKHKTLVSITRNPFDRYISLYLFGSWKERYPMIFPHKLYEVFPTFPDLTFRQYYDMVHYFLSEYRLRGIKPKMDLGVHSVQFIQFYFQNADQVLTRIDENYIQKGKWDQDMPEIEFLHQENLNQELENFLLSHGYSKDQIKHIYSMGRVNVSKRPKQKTRIDDFFGPDFKELVYSRDKLIFEYFPEYISIC
jgi:hypothetical protein